MSETVTLTPLHGTTKMVLFTLDLPVGAIGDLLGVAIGGSIGVHISNLFEAQVVYVLHQSLQFGVIFLLSLWFHRDVGVLSLGHALSHHELLLLVRNLHPLSLRIIL